MRIRTECPDLSRSTGTVSRVSLLAALLAAPQFAAAQDAQTSTPKASSLTESEISARQSRRNKSEWSRLETGMSQMQVINMVGLPESRSAHSDALDAQWEYWRYPFEGNRSLNWLVTFRDGSMRHVRVVPQESETAR